MSGYHGLHRFVPFPSHEHDKFVAPFVWSDGEGVVSHGSALDDIYDLSDYWHHGPITMTFPTRRKRKTFPMKLIRPYFDDLGDADVRWHGAFLVTTAARTVTDFIASGGRRDLARQAVQEGRRRKLFRLSAIPNRGELEL